MDRQANGKNRKGDSAKQESQMKKGTDSHRSETKDEATQCRDEMNSNNCKN